MQKYVLVSYVIKDNKKPKFVNVLQQQRFSINRLVLLIVVRFRLYEGSMNVFYAQVNQFY